MELSLLPTEIQCAVIRYLDPITLISISQTNTHFRSLVNPSERHFLERLLAYEVLPEYGGLSPFFDPSNNSVHPTYDNPAWSTMRLACPRCRRLLHHKHFDNHSILKLAYRKPAAAASAHELPTTSWEPSISLVYPRKTEKEKERLREKKLRRQYFLCVTGGQGHQLLDWQPEVTELSVLKNCNMEGFEDMSEDDFHEISDDKMAEILKRNARAIERERAGYKRLHRRCNECRYQLGRMPMLSPANHGDDNMPIVTCRQVPYGLHIDRWFPAFSYHLGNKRPDFNPVLSRIYRVDPWSQPITTFMARCARCACWQELRNFRIGGRFPHWKPFTATDRTVGAEMWDGREMSQELLREQHCNACFADVHGREELGAILVRWVHCLIDLELVPATSSLMQCFGMWRKMIIWLPKKYQDEAKTMRRHTPCLYQNRSSYRMTFSDVAMLRHRRSQWKDMAGRLQAEEERKKEEKARQLWWTDEADDAERWRWMIGCMDPAEYDAESEIREVNEWYYETESQFDEAEAIWRWFVGVRAEVEERPEVLVDWALSSSGCV